MKRYVILCRLTAHAPVKREDDLRVILSRERSETAKDLKSRISRSFGVFAPQDDGVDVIRSGAKDLKMLDGIFG